ncbi:hypothetical protein FN846DRAFT_908587 [Sphaerosporella brunnea]|uniref:Uncharacterized protein n=1 Tax=Sphaerosporella brunnea TaxID=1250544 RepID=A0A5J5ET08_9PEZI|nr:hypothetical protein FN846DRAFT_908587 [Sphaerosporella brunnea]
MAALFPGIDEDLVRKWADWHGEVVDRKAVKQDETLAALKDILDTILKRNPDGSLRDIPKEYWGREQVTQIWGHKWESLLDPKSELLQPMGRRGWDILWELAKVAQDVKEAARAVHLTVSIRIGAIKAGKTGPGGSRALVLRSLDIRNTKSNLTNPSFRDELVQSQRQVKLERERAIRHIPAVRPARQQLLGAAAAAAAAAGTPTASLAETYAAAPPHHPAPALPVHQPVPPPPAPIGIQVLHFRIGYGYNNNNNSNNNQNWNVHAQNVINAQYVLFQGYGQPGDNYWPPPGPAGPAATAAATVPAEPPTATPRGPPLTTLRPRSRFASLWPHPLQPLHPVDPPAVIAIRVLHFRIGAIGEIQDTGKFRFLVRPGLTWMDLATPCAHTRGVPANQLAGGSWLFDQRHHGNLQTLYVLDWVVAANGADDSDRLETLLWDLANFAPALQTIWIPR